MFWERIALKIIAIMLNNSVDLDPRWFNSYPIQSHDYFTYHASVKVKLLTGCKYESMIHMCAENDVIIFRI